MSDTHYPGSAHGPEGTPGSPAGEGDHAVRFEREDIRTGPVVWFVVGLIILTALTFAGVYGLMVVFNKTDSAAKKSLWPDADADRAKQESKEMPMSIGPKPGDEGRNRFRGKPGGDTPALNRSSIGNTPRLEGIGLDNSEHTVGRIHPGAAAEQRREEDGYLASWSKTDSQGPTIHVPIDVAMKHLVKATGPLPADEWQTAPGRSSSGRVSRMPGDDAAVLGHDPGTKEQPGTEHPREGHPEEPKK